ncbi:MAG: arylmalonate decarboxylase [Pseudomonadota bacterium]
MTDVQGFRANFGVLGPSTNTIVQPDFERMRVPGVTNHYSRIYTPDANAVSNDTFMEGTLTISENVGDAVDSVMTADIDYLVMGMSAITFYGGIEGGKKFQAEVEERSGVKISIGSLSVVEACRAYGNINKVAFVSPYFPVANEIVRGYFEESGLEVVRDHCLQCPTWTAIAKEPEDKLAEVLKQLDGDDVDALIQVGTNLSMVSLAAAAEKWLGKPVIAINTATYWHALRRYGIQDKVYGLGRLLEEF